MVRIIRTGKGAWSGCRRCVRIVTFRPTSSSWVARWKHVCSALSGLRVGRRVTQGCASLALGYVVSALQAKFPREGLALQTEGSALKACDNLAQGKRSAALGCVAPRPPSVALKGQNKPPASVTRVLSCLLLRRVFHDGLFRERVSYDGLQLFCGLVQRLFAPCNGLHLPSVKVDVLEMVLVAGIDDW